MHACHHVIKLGEQFIIEIEPAVGQNVALGAVKDAEVGECLIERVNFAPLRPHAVRREATRYDERLRVIRDAEVFVSQRCAAATISANVFAPSLAVV